LIPSQSDFNQWKKPYLLLVEYHQKGFLESPATFLRAICERKPTISLYRRFTFSCVFELNISVVLAI